MDESSKNNPLLCTALLRNLSEGIAFEGDDPSAVRRLIAALENLFDLVEDGDLRAAVQETIANITIFAVRKGMEIQALHRQAAAEEKSFQQMHQQLLKKNMELRERTMVDALTGLFNRRYFERSLAYDIERFRRYKRPIGIVLFDVDFFKRINDTFGHSIGDAALKHLSEMARTSIRSADLVARYGGEEFVLLLPETGSEGAAILAERLRQRVASTPLETEKGPLEITVSLGVFAVEGDFLGGIDDVMRNVDNALYAAKGAGRNCCVVA